jgi:hypothetical protein
MTTADTLLWALKQNYHLDKSNAAVHTSPVRYSPLTFRLAEALVDMGFLERSEPDPEGVHILAEVTTDAGAYAEDPGR